jgi:hypothetical protein
MKVHELVAQLLRDFDQDSDVKVGVNVQGDYYETDVASCDFKHGYHVSRTGHHVRVEPDKAVLSLADDF